MSEKFVIDSRFYHDAAHTEPMTGLIGPFSSRKDAEGWLDYQKPLWGSGSIVPLTRPTPWDPENFCARCYAGVESDEHHTKCVVTGYAEDGESA